ncbi:MAG: hypothetical protein IJW21_06745 [Clostridia bacterium]|nr:hypothetical protein [Clostridia bacterium]
MSEAEKKRRFDYKQNRNKWIMIGAIILAFATLITIILSATYFNLSKNYYINYTENGEIDYKVYLKENDFFDVDYLGKDQVYVASLVDRVVADFKYELHMEEEVNFSYSYKVNAVLKVQDKSTGVAIYNPSFELVPETVVKMDGKQQNLVIRKQAEINYDTYNEMANRFISAYDLKDVVSSVVLEMEIVVISTCESFEEENSRNNYNVSLHVPLTEQKVDVEMTSSVPTAESKILACTEGTAKTVFFVLSIIFGILNLILAGLFVAFIFLTRNTDINYSIKVKKVVSSYKTYIQKIINPFDRTGYQILLVDTFAEMLEIRDTIQSPILMNENEDQTCTSFMIPTNTKLLYIFEIKVDDYDEIYNTKEEDIVTDEIPEAEETGLEEETVIVMEDVDEEELAAAIALPDVELSEIDFEEDDDEEEEEGVEVIGVVWPERAKNNKVYRYDPNGERVTKGDIVLVPSRDNAKNKEIIRKATVAHGNHKVDPEHIKHPLKKIIGIVKRKAEAALMPKAPAEGEAAEEPAAK